MLERAERRKSSGGSNKTTEDTHSVGITPAEANLIAQLESSQRPRYTGDRADRADITRYTQSTDLLGVLANSPR